MSLTVLKTTAEFDSKIKEIADLIKRQNGLVPGLAPSTAREHTQSGLYLRAVQEIERFMPPRLPPTVYYPRLVYFGDEFAKNKDYRLASAECYRRFMDTDVQLRTGGGIEADLEEQLALETRSTLGLISCDFFLALEVDPEMRKPHTVEVVVKLLCQVRAAMQVVAPKKDLYWLIYNGTITIFTLCTPLLAFGYSTLAIEFLIFASQSMEAQVPLCQVKYIGWRARLYATVCLAYEETKMKPEALSFAERGLAAVRKLNKIESLDPVPPPAAMKRLLASAELEMQVNVIRYTDGIAGSQALELLQELPQLKQQLDKPGALLILVRAVIKCLEDSQRRTIRHQLPTEQETWKVELLKSLGETIQPKLEVLTKYDNPPPPAPEPAAEGEEGEGAGEEESGEKPQPVSAQEYEQVIRELPFQETVELLKYAFNFEEQDLFRVLLASCKLRLKYEDTDPKQKAQVLVLDSLFSLEHPGELGEEREIDPKVGEPVVAGEVEQEARVRRKLHDLSRVSRQLSALTDQNVAWEPDSASGPDLFADAALLVWTHAESLLDTVDASAPDAPEEPPPLPEPPQAPPKPQPVEKEAVTQEEPAPGPDAGEEGDGEEQPDAQGEEGGDDAGEAQGGGGDGEEVAGAAEAAQAEAEAVPTKTAWKRPPPTLRQLATLVLQGVHSTFMWVQLDDALLCGTVAVRLSNILEKRNRKEDALLVVEQGIETLNRARGSLLAKELSASEDWQERFALSSVSTNTANINVPRRPNEELEQALACLQVDLLHAKFRIILQLGVDDARRVAAAIEGQHARQRLQRTKNQTIFGTKSRKMLREELEQAERDQQRPVLPKAAVERELVASCNRNLYEKAIVLIEMAR